MKACTQGQFLIKENRFSANRHVCGHFLRTLTLPFTHMAKKSYILSPGANLNFLSKRRTELAVLPILERFPYSS